MATGREEPNSAPDALSHLVANSSSQNPILPAEVDTRCMAISTASPMPQSTQSHRYQKIESPSPPPRCPSPVKTSILVGQMGPPAPRPVRARSPNSMPPPPPRQPSQDAGARKRGREGSPPLPGQGSPLPSYRRSMSPPPRVGHSSPHGSPLSIPRSSSPPLPGARSPLRRPRSSSPPFENIIIIPQRQGSPIKVPRRSASPPLPGQGQGASAFKRPRSASPSDASFWHPGIPFPGRPLAGPLVRKPDAPADRDNESSASQRLYGAQRSGSSSSEEDRGRRSSRDDADATSSVQSHGCGASSSSSDENLGPRSASAEMADSSTSERRMGRRAEGPEPLVRRGGFEGPVGPMVNKMSVDAMQSRAGAMLPPPPRQPKRLSLPVTSAAIAPGGTTGRPEPTLSGESRVAHNSSDLALGAAASSSTAGTTAQAQDHHSTLRPSLSGQDDPPEESSLRKQASDASSVIGALQSAAISDASSVGRFRTPSPGPVSSGLTAVNSIGEALAAGQSTGSAMREDGDRVSTSKTGKAQGFKEPAAVSRSAASGVLPSGAKPVGAAPGRTPEEGQLEMAADTAESGVAPEAQKQGVKRPERPHSAGVLERVASNAVMEAKRGVADSALDLSNHTAPAFARQHSSDKASLMPLPKGWPNMPPPSTSKQSGLPRAGGAFKVPQQRPPSTGKVEAQPEGPTSPAMKTNKQDAGSNLGGLEQQPEDRAGESAGQVVKVSAFREDSAQEIAALLAGQESAHREAHPSSAEAQSEHPTTAADLPPPPTAHNTDASLKTASDAVAEKGLEPALRALFPAAMYKEPATVPYKAETARANNKAPPGQPPYETPPWSAPPGHPFQLEVVKEGAVLAQLDVSQKGAYMFGRSDRADFPLEHATVSRYHAVLQYKQGGEAALYDLGSTHGTFVNKKQVKARVYVPLRVGDVLKFGQSSRLYVFQGPSELMPEEGLSRAEKKQLKQLEAIQETKMEEESLARVRAAKLSEVTWGQMEDAEEEEEQEEVEDVTWETHLGPLTSNQEKAKEKVVKRREKIANLQKEIDAIQAKEIAQGGLTPGQQAQISRNEQRLEALSEELESMEETLNDSIRESLGAKARPRGGNKRGRAGSDEEEGDSDEDEFYNRAGAQQKKKKAAVGEAPAEAPTVETAETLLEKRDVLTREREVLQAEIKDEEQRERTHPGGQPEEDALDAFMSNVSTEIEKDKLKHLRRELELLDAEAARIARLLKFADPSGEAQSRWVAKTVPQESATRRKFTEPLKKEVPAPEEERAVQEEPSKPRGLLQTPKVALGQGVVKGPNSRVVKGPSLPAKGGLQTLARGGSSGGGDNAKGQAEKPSLVGEAGALQKSAQIAVWGGEEAAPEDAKEKEGRSIQGEARNGEVDVEERASGKEVFQEQGTGGSHREEERPEAAGGMGDRSRAGEDGKRKAGPGLELAVHKRLKDRVSSQGDEDPADQPAWEPPTGQTGDGRTELNDKLGY